MIEPKLAMIPSGYKSNKIYSILPNDDVGDFEFTRQSIGTRVRKDGLIEEVTNNVPKLDWLNSNCPNLLLEPQRTNLVLFSEQFSGTNWGTVNTTITADQETAPNGTLTANKLQRTSTSASYCSHNISKSASAITYTTSAFIKKGSDDYFSMRVQGSYPSRIDIRFRFDTEEIYYTQSFSNFTLLDYGVDKYQNGWYRLNFTYTSDIHTNLSITFSPRATNGTIDSSDNSSTSFAYVWGTQTEVANYVSSYIKTEASTVTRLKDECFNGGDSDLFDITEGTFFVDSYVYNSGNQTTIGLSDGSDSNKLILIFQSYGTQVRVFSSGGVSGFLNLTFDQRNKIAIIFKENEYKFFINGALVGSDTGATVPTGMDRLNFSNRTNTVNHFEGKIYDTRVYNRVLTEAEAVKLTTI